MARTIHRRPARKIKKSVTLSPESVKFLVAARKERRALSLSSVLEDILRGARLERERAAIEKNIRIRNLVALGKPFDFMDYPNRTHAISEGEGTSFHLFSLITRYLEEHVPPGGVASSNRRPTVVS
jgi:hypothetical protein